jgi:RNA polymerase sigma-B factor
VTAPQPAAGEQAADPATGERTRERAEVQETLRRMRRLPADDPEREPLRERIIAEYMSYARYVAGRYGTRSEDAEDLFQVAYMGLVKAVDNFDPDFGTTFLTYATPMILGEVKRHFRDSTWAVHVPRRMKELSARLRTATDELGQRLGRPPTIEELAKRLETTVEDIVDALDATDAHSTRSLDLPVTTESDSASFGELLGTDDPGIETIVNRETLKPLIARLPERDKEILLMRFFRGMTQSEIGEELGVSQMQVSRLLSRIARQLREGMDQ